MPVSDIADSQGGPEYRLLLYHRLISCSRAHFLGNKQGWRTIIQPVLQEEFLLFSIPTLVLRVSESLLTVVAKMTAFVPPEVP